MSITKHDLLTSLSIGKRVAEEEVHDLASYFVETEQWRKVRAGEVDVVFAPKGGGKSAIYATLLHREDDFFDGGTILIPAENPQGAPAFQDLETDPPTTEQEFVSLWKIYILSLLGSTLAEYDIVDEPAKLVRDSLWDAGLLPDKHATLRTRVRAAVDFVRAALTPRTIEGEVKIDPITGAPVGFGGKITLGEPSAEQTKQGMRSVDALLAAASSALAAHGCGGWILFDRLDIAFSNSRELEANALRSLFRVYLDLLSLDSVQLKIFLRTDIWKHITKAGFREASHITRQMTISWNQPSLLHLVMNRLLDNPALLRWLELDAEDVRNDATRQREFFDLLVPEKVDAGKNPRTFEWILGRVKDGKGIIAPREVIHLLTEARDAQIKMLERGEAGPAGTEIFSRQALRESMDEVSKVRIEQTLFAEYPEVRDWLTALEREKTEHNLESLSQVWGVAHEEARQRTERLIEIGFFELRGTKAEPRYWVPFLYRPGLQLVQGSAVPGRTASEVEEEDTESQSLT